MKKSSDDGQEGRAYPEEESHRGSLPWINLRKKRRMAALNNHIENSQLDNRQM